MTSFHDVPERLVPGTLAWDLYEVEHRQRYEFFSPQCRGLKVLDAACGVGYGTQILREQGAVFVAGIDLQQIIGIDVQCFNQNSGQRGLASARVVFQQHVAASQIGREDLIDGLCLARHHALDIGADEGG